MPAPIYLLGDYVEPYKAFRKVGDAPGVMVDAAGRHTTFGKVTAVPTAVNDALHPYVISSWGPNTGTLSTSLVGVWIYSVQIWDVDAAALVTVLYPESTIAPYAGNSIVCHATQYDKDRPPAELHDIAAAMRNLPNL